MRVKTHQDVQLEDGILIAGWPGMGNVGLSALNYLRRKLDASLLAEIDVSTYFTPDAILVENGIAKLPEVPANTLYSVQDPALIVFEGEIQLGGTGGIEVANEILNIAQQHRIRTVYTGAALALPVSYTQPSRILGVANQEPLRDTLSQYKVEIMQQGHVAGLNGLLLGFAGLRGVEAACLLATMPRYALALPNPKAAKALVEVFESILNVHVDMEELDQSIERMDQYMGEIEGRIRAAFSSLEEEEQPEEVDEDEVPHYAMERIERLFGEVRADRSRAPLLKEELDRWGLYELYEDRFLDLFRKGQQDEV